jgi:hypothetical protein
MEMRGAHELLVYAIDVNLLGRNTETLFVPNKELIRSKQRKLSICSRFLTRMKNKIII